jgi:hypothetical protein
LTNDESVLDSSAAISGCLATSTLMCPRRVLMVVMASFRTVATWDLSWVWELLKAQRKHVSIGLCKDVRRGRRGRCEEVRDSPAKEGAEKTTQSRPESATDRHAGVGVGRETGSRGVESGDEGGELEVDVGQVGGRGNTAQAVLGGVSRTRDDERLRGAG